MALDIVTRDSASYKMAGVVENGAGLMGWTPLHLRCAKLRAFDVGVSLEEAPMKEVCTIGLDIAKHVFQAHGADARGEVVFRKKPRRNQVLSFFADFPPCTGAMEACAGRRHWGREIGKLGRSVKLIAPAYVRPFVKRQKNDRNDAEAICEAVGRPSMRFVPRKSPAPPGRCSWVGRRFLHARGDRPEVLASDVSDGVVEIDPWS